MTTLRFRHSSPMPVSAEELFRWHLQPGAFERLDPPWERVEVLSRTGGVQDGSRIVLRTWVGGLPLKWELVHEKVLAGREFTDRQLRGPFRRWVHRHRFEPVSETTSNLVDEIEFALPGGALGNLLGGPMVRRKLEVLFRFRHQVTRADLEARREDSAMRIALTGGSGLVGSVLGPMLSSRGHAVVPLRRRPVAEGEQAILWLPDQGVLEARDLDGLDAVVHLAGENIASRRWNAHQKARIRESRVQGTRLLVDRILEAEAPPKVFVSASAIGFYGDRGDEELDEASAAGEGFLASVCQEWEQESARLTEHGIRVVHLRFGVILSSKGGALQKMLLPFRLGLGGVVGSGRQWMSWISVADAASAVAFALEQESLRGPVNAVSPSPVTNRQFTRSLGAALHRPTVLPMPAFAARLAFGEMADELLLGSAKVQPRALQQAGFAYQHPELDQALAWLLGS